MTTHTLYGTAVTVHSNAFDFFRAGGLFPILRSPTLLVGTPNFARGRLPAYLYTPTQSVAPRALGHAPRYTVKHPCRLGGHNKALDSDLPAFLGVVAAEGVLTGARLARHPPTAQASGIRPT